MGTSSSMSPVDPVLLKDRHDISLGSGIEKGMTDKVGPETEDQFPDLLERFGAYIRSPNLKVTGSIWIKHYSPLVVGALYAWIHHSYGMDVSWSNMKIALDEEGLHFHVSDPRPLAELDSAGSEEERTELYLRHLFAVNVTPVVNMAVRYTRIQEPHLWATLSYSMAYWKEVWMREAKTGEDRRRIEDVYRRMTAPGKAAWFPDKEANPLLPGFRSIGDPLHEGRRIMVRDKCCLNYCLPGEDRYCYTCPLITDERRIEKYLAVHAGK
ncbi:IucA/IucC family C-terminal-domain containing protein [Cohnella sp. CFH 77786]|uniref:IucA/IucC family C-terminal-domain containing protein n=1 Tax=Cohnella sp. CFH 77786 TaxID=2662265 RepID=UPI001C6090B2|nr:IucA/IucC family C-terminal-domain containing protein [Cohnella sp. CFH 77786]